VKLIIQSPCLNEADVLPQTFAELPAGVEGIDCIETLVIDDGSGDDTVALAEELGVDHIVSHATNLGLAKAFENGLQAALMAWGWERPFALNCCCIDSI